MIRIAAILFIAGTIMVVSTGRDASAVASQSPETTFNTRLWDDMMKKMVDGHGFVYYRVFQQNPLFSRIIEQIAQAKPGQMEKHERLAFYLNAYNALVIKNVIDSYPIASPNDVEGFYKTVTFNIGGTTMTLDALEYEHIIPLGGPYAHFGMVAGTTGCPKLIQMAYTGGNVHDQLRRNADTFLQDPSKNRLARHEKTLYLAEIFRQHEDDFKNEAGSLRDFVLQHLDDSDRQFMAEHEVRIDYLKENPRLNAK